jgi:hypothetical protein
MYQPICAALCLLASFSAFAERTPLMTVEAIQKNALAFQKVMTPGEPSKQTTISWETIADAATFRAYVAGIIDMSPMGEPLDGCVARTGINAIASRVSQILTSNPVNKTMPAYLQVRSALLSACDENLWEKSLTAK